MVRLDYPARDDDTNEVINDSQFHDVESGEYIAPGQTVDVAEDRVDEYLNHDRATFERAEDTAESADVDATEAGDGQDVRGDTAAEVDDAPLDPSDYTIAEFEDELDGRDLSDEELGALADAERSGEDRDGAMEAIDDQRGG